MAMRQRKPSRAENWQHLKTFALSLPGAWEDHPWGESVAKVKTKVFAFLGRESDDGSIGLSLKLPDTGALALSLPFVTPTGYGLGKSGWISATFAKSDPLPVDMIEEWILESYRAIAPKKLVKELETRSATTARSIAPVAPRAQAKRKTRTRTSASKAPKQRSPK